MKIVFIIPLLGKKITSKLANIFFNPHNFIIKQQDSQQMKKHCTVINTHYTTIKIHTVQYFGLSWAFPYQTETDLAIRD